MNPYSPEQFFDFSNSPAAELFRDCTYVWEAVKALPGYIEAIIKPELSGKVEEGAWLEPGRVQLGEGSRVERGAIIRGPAIIGRNTVVRTGAYIRGHVMTGENCLIGHGTELRQVLILNNSNIPHQNCIFTSLIGNRVRMGGHTSSANFRLDGREIILRLPMDGENRSFPTGLTLLGVVMGDDTSIGGMSLINPGTLIGQRCLAYGPCSLSGLIPHDSIVKRKATPFEITKRTDPK